MTAIFFDIDNTLYDQLVPFQKAHDQVFGNRFSVDIKALYAARTIRSDEVFEASQRGEISMEEMYIYRGQKAYADLGIAITGQEALEFQKHYAENQTHLELTPELIPVLDDLKERGTIMGVITNGPSGHQWKKIEVLGLERWILHERILVSGDHAVMKPDAAIFEIAQKRAGLDAGQMWYVGDSYQNDIRGAKNAGWHSLWLNRGNQDISGKVVRPDVTVTDVAGLCREIQRIAECGTTAKIIKNETEL